MVEHEAYRYWDHWLSDGRVRRLLVADVRSQRIVDLFTGTPYELPRADPSAHHGSDQIFFGATVTYATARGEERTITIQGSDEAEGAGRG